MAGYRIIFVCLLLFLSSQSFAQRKPSNSLSYVDKNGVWSFEKFNEHVIKTTFRPFGYSHTEQVSNAVIEKPSPSSINKNTIKFPSRDKNEGLIYQYAGMVLNLITYFDSTKFKGFKFRLKANEQLFGTGERSIPLNRRGYKLNLYNNPWYGYGMNADNLNYSVPFIISSLGYGIFFDNPSRSYLDIGKSDPGILEYGASSGELTFYLVTGHNVDEVLRSYQALVGTQPIPARWVFGNLMSRFGYRNEAQLMNIVEKMKEDSFPVDAVILDLFWFGDSIKGTMGNLEWTNKNAWPQPANMIAKLKRQHINTILITEPFVLNTTPNYLASRKFQAVDSAGNPYLLTDFYFGKGGLLDIFRNDTRNWFWDKYKRQIAKGVAGWWGDLGEPEKHPAGMYHNLKDLGYTRLFISDEVHNIFGHYWDKMLYDKYAQEYPGVRLFNLNRSGYAGSPRYCVFPWSGDVSRSWDGLNAQLPLMIGMSMSGVPYIHSDAGGFAGGDGDEELYTRWLQLAVFTPVFRPHGTAFGDIDSTIKNIPSEGALHNEPYKTIVRQAYQLRYQLLPYNYSLAYEQEAFGKPLIRPLFYYDYTDSNLMKVQDEYMWGDALLVCPVLQKGVTERKVYLPQGNWYDFFSGNRMEGGRWITVNVDLNAIPVFAKEGSMVPMFIKGSPIYNTSEYSGKKITIKYFPSSLMSNYKIYDDDGVTKGAMAKGNYELIDLKATTASSKVIITINSGKRKGIIRKMKIVLPGRYNISAVNINNRRVGSSNNHEISFVYEGVPATIEIQLH